MAFFKLAKTEQEIKKMPIAEVRKEYLDIGDRYNKLLNYDYVICPTCGRPMTKTEFYADKRYAIGFYPECKDCVVAEVEQRKNKNDKPNETKESTQKMLQKMDLPYLDDLYNSVCERLEEEGEDSYRGTPWRNYIALIKSLKQYANNTWKDSQFGAAQIQETNKQARKEIKKIFGLGYSETDYLYLQDQYDDLRARTQVDSKSQEIYAMQICLQLLDIDKDRKAGRDVTNKLKALDTLMNSANLQPKQNVTNAATDSLTFGQLIEKWEMEKPIPEPTPEFKDVDGIGKYIRVWFAGWLSKALGLKGAFTEECEEYIKQYTVTKPTFTDDNDGNFGDAIDALFNKEGE